MSFEKIRTKDIPAIQAQVQEYAHAASGARHIHLTTDYPEMAFLAAFPTLPQASDGCAHILEHLVLCGSSRYPVRDPFFGMSRRSMAHFMNAMTYADKTVFPFACTDKTDFFNLLDVYLDAAFFPCLNYLDFLQEGWRLVLDHDRLAYHGIVFNEMKGAFSDPMHALISGINARLLQGTTYEFDSGGDPLHIPSLTHAMLKEFHASHYHPSQAVFMTAGRIDPTEVQGIIQERVLSRLTGREPRKLPQLASAWNAPQECAISTPSGEYGVQMSWLMGESADTAAYYHAELLEAGLLGNAAAPLSRAMESAGFGRPSALNGVDADGRQFVFHLGMEGLTKEQVGAARKRIWSALRSAAKEGVPLPILQAALRDMRFYQREIEVGDTSYLLSRLLHALPYAMYDGDIMHGFDDDEILDRLQHQIADPAFFRKLVQTLLDSSTRLDAVVMPDAAYFQRRQQLEDERLAALQKSMPESEKQRLRSDAVALLERQRQPVDNNVLPRIRPQDVSPLPRPAFALPAESNGVLAVSIASNGISYANVVYDVSDMDEAAWPWLQLYVNVLSELGTGDRSYEEAAAWRYDRVPYFDVDLHVSQRQDEAGSLRVHIGFHAKGAREESPAIAEVLSESIRRARFDENERLAFLIDSLVQDMRNDLAEDGDEYARLSAMAPLSSARKFEDAIHGVASLPFYRALHLKSLSKQGIREIARWLAQLHQQIVERAPTIIAAGMENDGRMLADLLDLPQSSSHSAADAGSPAPAVARPLCNAALHAPAQVNHCFAAWRAPRLAHPDAPALAVLGALQSNLVLHQALREEGGAYGGDAGYSPSAGAFVMSTYRDPRLAATYRDFEQAIQWVIGAELKQENIEEAIICVIQGLDAPLAPYADVMSAWDQRQQGITEEMRRQFRHGVLHCTAENIRTAAATWLLNTPYSRSAFAGDTGQDLAGLTLVDLTELIAPAAAQQGSSSPTGIVG
jgi:hypothetical protein